MFSSDKEERLANSTIAETLEAISSTCKQVDRQIKIITAAFNATNPSSKDNPHDPKWIEFQQYLQPYQDFLTISQQINLDISKYRSQTPPPKSEELIRTITENLSKMTKAIKDSIVDSTLDTSEFSSFCRKNIKTQRGLKIEELVDGKIVETPALYSDPTNLTILPFQRFSKYPLLTKELQKHIAPEHFTQPLLANSIAKIESTITLINEIARISEGRDDKKIAELIIQAGISTNMWQNLFDTIIKKEPAEVISQLKKNWGILITERNVLKIQQAYIKQQEKAADGFPPPDNGFIVRQCQEIGIDLNKEFRKNIQKLISTLKTKQPDEILSELKNHGYQITPTDAIQLKRSFYLSRLNPDIQNIIKSLITDKDGKIQEFRATTSSAFHRSTTLHLIDQLNKAYEKYKEHKKIGRTQKVEQDLKQIGELLSNLGLQKEQISTIIKQIDSPPPLPPRTPASSPPVSGHRPKPPPPSKAAYQALLEKRRAAQEVNHGPSEPADPEEVRSGPSPS